MDNISRIVALGKLQDEKGRVLYLKIARTGEWGLPGGKINLGETPRAAVVREIKEEIGINVVVESVIGVREKLGDDNKYWTYIIFAVSKIDENIEKNLEPEKILQMEWREET